MFGRVDLCDFVLEHPTISRFHAGTTFFCFFFFLNLFFSMAKLNIEQEWLWVCFLEVNAELGYTTSACC